MGDACFRFRFAGVYDAAYGKKDNRESAKGEVRTNLERGEEIHDWAKNEVIELEHKEFSLVHDDSTAFCGFFHGNELRWVLCAD